MSATLEWMRENPDKCAACSGTGTASIPGKGFATSACETCEGDGLSDEYCEMNWKQLPNKERLTKKDSEA